MLHLVMNSFFFRLISLYYGSQSLIFVSAMTAFLWPICILYKLSMNLFFLFFTNQIFHFISNISTELWKWFDFSSHLPLLFFFPRQLSWQMTTFYLMQIKIWIYMCSCKISIHYQNIESLKCREWLRFLLIACRTILHVCISSTSLDLSFASKSAYRF